MALEVVDVVLQTLAGFHLDCDEVVVVPLEFLPRNRLVEECIGYVRKFWKEFLRRVKPVVGNSLEARRECSAKEKIIVSIDHHFILIMA